MRIPLLIILFLLIPSVSFSQYSSTTSQQRIYVCEEDGDPCKRFYKLIFANNALIDNGDGSVTIDIAAVPSVAENVIFNGENVQFAGEDVIYYP